MDDDPHSSPNIIVMSEHREDTGYAAISQVEGYWDALRGSNLVPKRSDLDPRGIELALSCAFIIERTALGVGRLRIAGSHLCDLMGMEVRGMPLTSLFTSASRQTVTRLMEEVFQAPAVAHLTLSAARAPQRPELPARMVLLPLKSDLGDVSRILGCLVAKGEMGEAPRRFDVVSHDIRYLGPVADALPPMPPADISPQGSAGFQEPAAPFERRRTTVPYLRLVKSDEEFDPD
jgi:hypothetical protein